MQALTVQLQRGFSRTDTVNLGLPRIESSKSIKAADTLHVCFVSSEMGIGDVLGSSEVEVDVGGDCSPCCLLRVIRRLHLERRTIFVSRY